MLQSLLMYGRDDVDRAGSVDLPSGSVLGLPKGAEAQVEMRPVAVGANSLETIQED